MSSLDFAQFTTVPGSGQFYSLTSTELESREIATGYAQRQDASAITQNTRRGPGLGTILGIFDLLSGVLDLTSSALSSPSPVPQRVKHRITFKNDADIILVPGQVNVPAGYVYNSAPKILFPGEVCVFSESHLPHQTSSERLSFSFGAISTDEDILLPQTPSGQADVFPFEVHIGRDANNVFFERVHGFVGDSHAVHNFTVRRVTGGDMRVARLAYVGFRGFGGTTMPSFGIAVVQTLVALAAGTTMGTQVTFTPLNLRA
ncbi:hypothetical protein [Paraburkholderia nodosa]|uniref:hypothetical protein n=1 Tax=Paraburkholderia nodosa TaxID=392320 RepID=UPI0012B67FFC|nr:hypothetical protein [Paraburkholderia nodosa]